MHISSRQNQRIKEAVKLRNRRARNQQGRFIVDGVREISRAISAGVTFLEAYFLLQKEQASVGSSGSSVLQQLSEQLENQGTEIHTVTADVFEKLSFGDRSEGIVAVAQSWKPTLQALTLKPNSIVVVLEGIEKPGNVGAIARSADAAGVAAMIFSDSKTDCFNPNAIRASAGALFSVQFAEASAEDTITWLKNLGLPIFATRPDAVFNYTEVDFTSGGAIVLGNEANGLTDIWSGSAFTPVQLPMLGIADSLNVSTTAAVLFYEALRQRNAQH